jgi:hypothetical protein
MNAPGAISFEGGISVTIWHWMRWPLLPGLPLPLYHVEFTKAHHELSALLRTSAARKFIGYFT